MVEEITESGCIISLFLEGRGAGEPLVCVARVRYFRTGIPEGREGVGVRGRGRGWGRGVTGRIYGALPHYNFLVCRKGVREGTNLRGNSRLQFLGL